MEKKIDTVEKLKALINIQEETNQRNIDRMNGFIDAVMLIHHGKKPQYEWSKTSWGDDGK